MVSNVGSVHPPGLLAAVAATRSGPKRATKELLAPLTSTEINDVTHVLRSAFPKIQKNRLMLSSSGMDSIGARDSRKQLASKEQLD